MVHRTSPERQARVHRARRAAPLRLTAQLVRVSAPASPAREWRELAAGASSKHRRVLLVCKRGHPGNVSVAALQSELGGRHVHRAVSAPCGQKAEHERRAPVGCSASAKFCLDFAAFMLAKAAKSIVGQVVAVAGQSQYCSGSSGQVGRVKELPPNPSLKRTVTGRPAPGNISFLPGAVLPAPAA